MDIEIEYLLTFLQDELQSVPELKIRPVLPISTVRAPDLPQDYDAKANKLHTGRGVRVYVGSRDFFFPADWVREKQYEEIHRQAAEIKSRFGD
jgi:hypothetical protein